MHLFLHSGLTPSVSLPCHHSVQFHSLQKGGWGAGGVEMQHKQTDKGQIKFMQKKENNKNKWLILKLREKAQTDN